MIELLILVRILGGMALILCSVSENYSVKSGEMEGQCSQKWNASQIDKALVPLNASL